MLPAPSARPFREHRIRVLTAPSAATTLASRHLSRARSASTQTSTARLILDPDRKAIGLSDSALGNIMAERISAAQPPYEILAEGSYPTPRVLTPPRVFGHTARPGGPPALDPATAPGDVPPNGFDSVVGASEASIGLVRVLTAPSAATTFASRHLSRARSASTQTSTARLILDPDR